MTLIYNQNKMASYIYVLHSQDLYTETLLFQPKYCSILLPLGILHSGGLRVICPYLLLSALQNIEQSRYMHTPKSLQTYNILQRV